MPGVVSAVGHVALQVQDLPAAVEMSKSLLGLRVVEQTEEWTYLTHGAPHHSLQYRSGDVDGIHHIGLEAPNDGALKELRERLENEDMEILSEAPIDPELESGLVFVGPEGFVFEVYTRMPNGQPSSYSTKGVRPISFGHVNLGCGDSCKMAEFLQRVLDFRVSDHGDSVWFLRCDTDHHAVACVASASSRLRHHAWEVDGISDLQRMADRLDQEGKHVLWGPVRHGMGNNIAIYFNDSAGGVIEYYCDMERIPDDTRHEVKKWDMSSHRWYSLWAPDRPRGLTHLGLPPVDVDKARESGCGSRHGATSYSSRSFGRGNFDD